MSFTRTRSGLSNLALFFKVDYIVYTEGGNVSYSFADVLDGKFNDNSVDIKFWHVIFNKHGFNKKVYFRALGSKSSLKEICNRITSGDISNVIVTLDSDLDEFIGTKFDSPFILYTRGYSWENDVYHPDLVKDQIESFVLTAEFPEEYLEIIKQVYQNFEHHASRLLKIEIMFRKNNLKFITDCNGERFINGKSIPKLHIDQMLRLLVERKGRLIRPVEMPEIPLETCPIRYSYGKLQEALGLALIYYIASILSGIKSFPKNMIVASMIERYKNRLNHIEDKYYSDIIGRLKAL